jgi:hypothetical protein
VGCGGTVNRPPAIHRWVGIPAVNFKFLTIFLRGSAFDLPRDRIGYMSARLVIAGPHCSP